MQDKLEFGHKNRITIIALFVIFLAPMVLAYASYHWQGIEEVDTTNYGELLDPPAQVADQQWFDNQQQALTIDSISRHWRLFYISRNGCDDTCEMNLLTMRQVNLALGKEGGRLKRWLVGDVLSDSVMVEYPQMQFIANSKQSPLSVDYIYLMDPLGNIILRYPAIKTEQELKLYGKGILKDLKRLMKISQIG